MWGIYIRSFPHRSIVSSERIGIYHLSFRKEHGKTCIRIVLSHRILSLIGRCNQGKNLVILSGNPYAVRHYGGRDVNCTIPQTYISKVWQMSILLILDTPVTITIIYKMHTIIASVQKCLLYIFISCGRRAEEIAPHSNILMSIRIMQIIISKAETIMSGAQSPVPILLFKRASAVKFHDFITRK